MTIVFIVGLPGSGKTYFGNKLAKLRNAVYLDDISLNHDPLNAIQQLICRDIIISDVFLCRKDQRDKALKFVDRMAKLQGVEYDIEWIFFENNPEQCLKNVSYRNKNGDKRLVSDLIKFLSKEYTIPVGVEQLKIWRNDEASF